MSPSPGPSPDPNPDPSPDPNPDPNPDQVKADQAIEVSWQQEAAVTTYCVLVVLWLINWIAAIAWASMSCAVAYWFTYDNAPGAEHKCCKTGTGFTRLASATWTITSKHLGSLAVGAFVIALCQTLRLGMKLLDSMTQQARGKSCMPKLGLTAHPHPHPHPSPSPSPHPHPNPYPYWLLLVHRLEQA